MSADAFIPKHMTAVPSFAHRNAHNVEKEISHRALHTRERTPRLRHTTLSTPPDARRERERVKSNARGAPDGRLWRPFRRIDDT